MKNIRSVVGSERCLLCHESSDSDLAWCCVCLADLTTHGPIGSSPTLQGANVDAWAAYRYQYPLANVLQAAKYHDRYAYTRVLSQLFYQRVLEDSLVLPDAILPVPLHLDRLRDRGFNQAHLIAEQVAKRFQIPIIHSAIRSKATAQQAGMKLAERKRNMRNAFGIVEDIPYANVVIVDDVVTTGSTVGELAACLYKQGVDEVSVWALAYAAPST